MYVHYVQEMGGWIVFEGGGMCAFKRGGPFSTKEQAEKYLQTNKGK